MGIKALVADRPRRVQSPHPACSPYRPRHVLGASGPLTARSRTVALGDRRSQRHPPRVARLSPSPTLSARSDRVPRQPLDAPENLPKEVARQVVLGQLEDEVPRMPDQATVRLEEPLLETCKRPTLNGWRQDEPSQQIAEVVGDHSEQQADLIRTEAVAREARPMGGFLALYNGTPQPASSLASTTSFSPATPSSGNIANIAARTSALGILITDLLVPSLATSPGTERRRGAERRRPARGAAKLGRRNDPHDVSLCVENRHGRDGLIARRQPNGLHEVPHGSCLPWRKRATEAHVPLPQTGHRSVPISKHVSQSRHRTVRPNGRCNVLTVSRALISFTPLGGFGRLLGCSVTAPRVRFPGLIFCNGGGACRILKGVMAYQLLLDVALIIVAMGALHRFEASRFRSVRVRPTPRAQPLPNPGRKAT